MITKLLAIPLKIILQVILAFTLSVTPVFGDTIQDGIDAYERDDRQSAKKILTPFAEEGNEVAQYYLGMMHIGSSEKRFKWFTLSANQGYAKSMVMLAWHYKIDNCDKALKWIHLAVSKKSADAYDELGVWYYQGTCVPRNDKEAIRLYHLAANKGSTNAQDNLGKLYYFGDMVPQDYVLAHKWFNISSSKASKSVVFDPSEWRRKVQKLMTPNQIAEAQKLAREWVKNH
jgi:TPR repeat protein